MRGIVEKMREGGDIGVANHVNPAYVMPTQHADVFRLYCSQANLITELSPWSKRTMEWATGDREYMRDHVIKCIDAAEDQLHHLREAIEEALEKPDG